MSKLMSLPRKQLLSNSDSSGSIALSVDSGHGGQAEDLDGDEDDGFDETILPLDFKQAGQIIDDELHHHLVKSLPPGCRLTAIFDSVSLSLIISYFEIQRSLKRNKN